MSKRTQQRRRENPTASASRMVWLAAPVAIAVGAAILWIRQPGPVPTRTAAGQPANATNLLTTTSLPATNIPSIEVAQAVVVTVDLDFSSRNPYIHDALKQIERRYEPDDGAGRTFAILDAWGETNSNGKLRVSMHLSMEKPGRGSLVFKRTGEMLWQSRIVAASTGPAGQKNLTIIMDDHDGQSVMLDGTKGATRVLDVPLHNSTSTVRDLWPDGQDREFTFIYSVCGCPVKVNVRRRGETTERTTELPVMFPDDPAAMKVINSLMGWAGP